MLNVGDLHVHLCQPLHEAEASGQEVFADAGRVTQALHHVRHTLLQRVPAVVGLLHPAAQHSLVVCAPLLGQTAVLLVDGLQVSQAVMHLALKGLGHTKGFGIKSSNPQSQAEKELVTPQISISQVATHTHTHRAGLLIYQKTQEGHTCIADLDSGALALTKQASGNSHGGGDK